ncbi:MAG: flippase-like domain-containing protein [Proteobacteria bacterium]|nr:flippase-like domain-containing protein [Pseudomonadota bacterium]
MRRLIMLLLKAAISILLLYLSLRAVNLAVLGERLSRLHPGWLIVAVGILAAQVFLLAARWRLIATGCGIASSFRTTLRISFIAMFFNQVLPSTVGGDAARIWMLAREGGGWAASAYSVLLDRVAGIVALTLIVFICLPWTLTLVQDPVARIVLILIGGSAIAGSFVFLAIGHIRWKPLMHWAPTRHLVEVSRTGWRICGSWRDLTAIGTMSFTVHLMTILAAWCMMQSVSAMTSFALLLYLVPPVILIATVPVSIAGWGVREGSMIVAFAYAGLPQSDGLVVSVLIGLTFFAIGAIGGVIWILNSGRRSTMTVSTGPAPGGAP